MSNLKKVIGVVLAFAMILSVASVASFAAGENYIVTVTAGSTTLAPGESTTVSVYVTANYYVSGMSIPVFFDNDNVTVASIDYVLTGGNASTETSAAAEKVFANSGYTYGEDGLVLFTYVAEVGDELSQYSNVKVLEFTVTANADATGSVDFECPTGAKKTASNITGALYVLMNQNQTPDEDGKVYLDSVAEVVETATLSNEANITFASAMADADLELTAQGTTDGVVIDTRITFGGQYAGVVYGFNHINNTTFRSTTYLTNSVQATNGGSLVFGRSIGTAGYGTGTTITVKNADDSVSKVYVVVIFGDVNGDGLINVNDTNACKGYVSAPTTLTNKVVRMAANCQKINNATMMYNLNVNDTNAIKAYVSNGATKVSQAELAATVRNLASVNANYA